MIVRLQNSASSAVITMDNGTLLSGYSVLKQADTAGEIFNQINLMLNKVTDASHQIATAVEEQAYVTEDINRSIHNIRELADTSTLNSHNAVERITLLVERLQGLSRLKSVSSITPFFPVTQIKLPENNRVSNIPRKSWHSPCFFLVPATNFGAIS